MGRLDPESDFGMFVGSWVGVNMCEAKDNNGAA
jgi:hypothetical protein